MIGNEFRELKGIIEILNKYRNIWSHSDRSHEDISSCINDFLPKFSKLIDQFAKRVEENDK